MSSTFLISDTHFGHGNIVKFCDANGDKIRPWDDLESMTEDMVRMWNETVKPQDKVYHLGDVAIARRGLDVLRRLNGRKVLIRGNHDIFKLQDYAEHFYDIRGVHVLPKSNIIMSHIPLHPDNLKSRNWRNIHGHLHSNRVMKVRAVDVRTGETQYSNQIDPRYFNASVEQISYRPISFDEVLKQLNKD
jgi:calcineurin-like phosphoesterase family protein